MNRPAASSVAVFCIVVTLGAPIRLEAQSRVPEEASTAAPPAQENRRPTEAGALGDALRNLRQFAEQQAEPSSGPADVRFNAKGVEFGPWIRQFRAVVLRNWFVPLNALDKDDETTVALNVQRDGTISGVQVIRPAQVAPLTAAAVNALRGASPVAALPALYPDASLPITITFYYQAPGREFVLSGRVEFYLRPDAPSYQLLTEAQMAEEGIRLFALGTETSNGRTMTKVRLRPRSGGERVGWISRTPTESEFARAQSPR